MMMNAVSKRPALTRLILSSLVFLGGCVPPKAFDTSPGHISQPAQAAPIAPPPAPVKALPALAPPRPSAPVPTYTVVVNDVPVKDLLFSIARDTQYHIDLHPGISGNVSLNAVQEPLPAILDRIARQANLRYEMNGRTVSIMPDTPYVKTYSVNYVNVARNTTSSVGVAAQIASTGGGNIGTGATGTSSTATGNSSTTTVASQSSNDLWTVLADNIRTLLAGTRAVTQSNEERAARLDAEKAERAERVSQAEAASKAGAGAASLFTAAFANQPAGDGKNDVAVNPVAGTVTVLGTAKQQELVQQYLDRVMQSAQRQVLIEATIVEVSLKDQYRMGIDWTKVLAAGASGWKIETLRGVIGSKSNPLADSLAPFIQATYTNTGDNGFTAMVDLLESFGNTKVLSSPKLMALNNQTALLKVVNNLVYFTVKADTVASANAPAVTTFTTTPQTIPVGLVMSVLPQINENGMVSLTVRPTISRQVSSVQDPNPDLRLAGVPNSIPVIQVREMESLLQVRSGQTVILGGLIQDDRNNARDGIPGLSRPEGIGAVFGQHERINSQTELVIFLRPIVVSNPTLESDELRQFQRLLPSSARSSP